MSENQKNEQRSNLIGENQNYDGNKQEMCNDFLIMPGEYSSNDPTFTSARIQSKKEKTNNYQDTPIVTNIHANRSDDEPQNFPSNTTENFNFYIPESTEKDSFDPNESEPNSNSGSLSAKERKRLSKLNSDTNNNQDQLYLDDGDVSFDPNNSECDIGSVKNIDRKNSDTLEVQLPKRHSGMFRTHTKKTNTSNENIKENVKKSLKHFGSMELESKKNLEECNSPSIFPDLKETNQKKKTYASVCSESHNIEDAKNLDNEKNDNKAEEINLIPELNKGQLKNPLERSTTPDTFEQNRQRALGNKHNSQDPTKKSPRMIIIDTNISPINNENLQESKKAEKHNNTTPYQVGSGSSGKLFDFVNIDVKESFDCSPYELKDSIQNVEDVDFSDTNKEFDLVKEAERYDTNQQVFFGEPQTDDFTMDVDAMLK